MQQNKYRLKCLTICSTGSLHLLHEFTSCLGPAPVSSVRYVPKLNRSAYMRLNFFFKFFLLIVITISCNEDQIKNVVRYDYLTYLPSEYQHDETKKWPLIIFLHGASLRGNNLEKIKKYGIPK